MPLLWNCDKKIVIFHIPKSGGTSLYKYITHIDGGFIHYWNPSQMSFSYIHCSQEKAKCLFQEKTGNLPQEICTVVRNPYDRFISAFLHTHLMGLHSYPPTLEGCLSLVEDLKNKSLDDPFWSTDLGTFFRPQHTFFSSTDENHSIHILHIENIAKELPSILEHWGYTPSLINTIPFNEIHNKSPFIISKEEWYLESPLLKDWVSSFYSEDFSRFHYQV
jgi:hypothetical protein